MKKVTMLITAGVIATHLMAQCTKKIVPPPPPPPVEVINAPPPPPPSLDQLFPLSPPPAPPPPIDELTPPPLPPVKPDATTTVDKTSPIIALVTPQTHQALKSKAL